MRQCWNEEPKNRPSFDDICVRLEEILMQLSLNEYVARHHDPRSTSPVSLDS
jgi:hypothetical protein